ncbi:uncharacterized protein [Spinacia oleracea]|uniref:No apical meristem-associated C-terminal domain-containing protein n=1 Tax=Spinacia oleracea TaxID=3562 RepID=A0ABM3QQ04_SPIOL|nr:uncharacterized protein LOC130461383 [Spinacia oleracea]
MPFENQYPTQSLGEDEDEDEDEEEVQVQNNEVIKVNKGKQKKDMWFAEEEKYLVPAYINCSGDPEKGTDQKKEAVWNEIKGSYDASVVNNLNVLHKRTMKSLKKRWGQINEAVTSWVAALGLAERMQASGEVINDLEEKAHELYRHKRKDGQPFIFHHCWLGMQHLPRWMHGRDSTIVSEGSSKRSSDEAGMPKRPDGVKKVKAQKKLKGVTTSLDEFNNTLSGMSNERGMIRKEMSDMLEYQKHRDETKLRFKMFQFLMTKSHLEPFEEEYLAKLKEEFMK